MTSANSSGFSRLTATRCPRRMHSSTVANAPSPSFLTCRKEILLDELLLVLGDLHEMFRLSVCPKLLLPPVLRPLPGQQDQLSQPSQHECSSERKASHVRRGKKSATCWQSVPHMLQVRFVDEYGPDRPPQLHKPTFNLAQCMHSACQHARAQWLRNVTSVLKREKHQRNVPPTGTLPTFPSTIAHRLTPHASHGHRADARKQKTHRKVHVRCRLERLQLPAVLARMHRMLHRAQSLKAGAKWRVAPWAGAASLRGQHRTTLTTSTARLQASDAGSTAGGGGLTILRRRGCRLAGPGTLGGLRGRAG